MSSHLSPLASTSYRQPVRLRDNVNATKPLGAGVTIDGVAVANLDRVLFTALAGGELGDNNKVWRPYIRDGEVISWQLALDGRIPNGEVEEGDLVFIDEGAVFADTRYEFAGGSWVAVGGGGGPIIGPANTMAGYDSLGALSSFNSYTQNSNGGLNTNGTVPVNNESISHDFENVYVNVEILSASPNDQAVYRSVMIEIDNADSGFGIGTNGQALIIDAANVVNNSSSSMGAFVFGSNTFSIGDGVSPISLRGFSYYYGFGQVNANVDLTGHAQGYGFQFSMNAAATTSGGVFAQAFYDAVNIECAWNGQYTSANFSPSIAEITNNSNYNGLNINPAIDILSGNAGFFAINITPQTMSLDSGTWMGLNINPQSVTSASGNAYGINVTMDNVSVFPGAQASLVVQDLTFEFVSVGSGNNSYQIEYVSDTTAGNESVTIAGFLITIHMESGVSTANQIKTACDANFSFASAISTTVTGVGTNAQVAAAPDSFTGGLDPAQKLAAYLDGDVQITGSLSFGGALSVGQLNAFASLPLVSGSGVTSVHSLISQRTVAANDVIVAADSLGVNTAGLMQIGDNASVSTSFLGMAALGLPAVISMGIGSTLDRAAGAVFAVSLDATATGGVIAELNLCNAIAIPNGVTSITKLVGYNMVLPAGNAGFTNIYGVYIDPEVMNYMAGSLVIGEDSDTPTNSSIALEIKSLTKALRFNNMTTLERDALTALPGMVIFNTDTLVLEFYNGAVWAAI